MSPDFYTAIVVNNQNKSSQHLERKDTISIVNIKQEMARLNIILGICKTRWPGNREFVSDKHRIIHAGGEKNERFRVNIR